MSDTPKFIHPDQEIEIQKTYVAGGANSDLANGGLFTEEQQKDLVVWVANHGSMLAQLYNNLGNIPSLGNYPASSAVAAAAANQLGIYSMVGNAVTPGNVAIQYHSNGATSGRYPQMHARGAVVRKATEATQRADQYNRKNIIFSEREWRLEKVQFSYSWTTEFMEQNIRGQQLNQAMGGILGRLMANDFEDLAINGDAALPIELDQAGNQVERNELLRINDGWLKIARNEMNGHSHGGEYIDEHLYTRVLKALPLSVASAPDYKWWQNPQLTLDYREVLRSLGADYPEIAQMAYKGEGILKPCGFPIVHVPLFPIDQPLATFAAATSARLLTARPGPFTFRTDGFRLSINVDGAGAVEIVFPTIADPDVNRRLVETYHLADMINTQYAAAHGAIYANIARPFGEYVEIVSPTAGAASSIVIANSANSAINILGLRAQAVTGEAAGAGNTVFEGTPLILSPDWNFKWHVGVSAPGADRSTGIRMFTKYDQGSDLYLTDAYTVQDATIDNPAFGYYVRDVRVARPGVSVVGP